MSAIAGIVHFNQEPIPAASGDAMMEALRKFPADDVRTWQSGPAFLGCHAQWITPESIGEVLPYYDAERQLAITADAIIDNREELFEALQIEPSLQKEMPDSRLILLAYAKWGEACPQRLLGDFAFMIWDEREQKLFGARDFSGTRTLYYVSDHGRFMFSTLMRPLLAVPGMQRKVNEQWIAEFLAIPFTLDAVDLHATVYASVQQLPPAHSITVRRGTVSLRRYIVLRAAESLPFQSNEEYEEALRDVFGKAVKARIRTHRNVGSHLSGGLDSSSVASFAARELREQNKKLNSFSYVPVDDFVDWTEKNRLANEKPFIQETVDYVGNIEPHYISCDDKNPYSVIDDWIDTMEMPYKFYENSYWINGIYEEAADRNINIMLGGQRGNWTISWGYALEYQALLLKQFRWIRLYREMMGFVHNNATSRTRVLKAVAKKAFPAIVNVFVPKNEDYHPKLIHPDFAQSTNVLQKIAKAGINITGKQESAYAVKKQQFEKLHYWSLNGAMGTKRSIKHGVWPRDPTNDLRVVRFCLSVPEEQFVQHGIPRSLIRRSMQGYLPDTVRLNQRVKGIQGADGVHRMVPVWKDFIGEAERVIGDPQIKEYLNTNELRQALAVIRDDPKPEWVYDSAFRLVMRSVIFARFMKRFA